MIVKLGRCTGRYFLTWNGGDGTSSSWEWQKKSWDSSWQRRESWIHKIGAQLSFGSLFDHQSFIGKSAFWHAVTQLIFCLRIIFPSSILIVSSVCSYFVVNPWRGATFDDTDLKRITRLWSISYTWQVFYVSSTACLCFEFLWF